MKVALIVLSDPKSWETFVLSEVQRTESAYIATPSDDTKRAWLVSQSLSRQLALQKAENKRLFAAVTL